jgi:ubiquinone/menaquinone biosynthesis C-methylase UbiE
MEQKGEFVDIGGSKNFTNVNPKYKWEIMDIMGNPKYVYDLNSGEKFPQENKSIHAIYCSMTLEHIHPLKIQHVLNEMYRILIKDGKIRIVVPDIEYAMNLYFKDPEQLINNRDFPAFVNYYPPTKCGYLFSWINSPPPKPDGRSGHQIMFDYEMLSWYLDKSNFRNITRRKYNKCSEEFTGKDIDRYASWSLYVEAEK